MFARNASFFAAIILVTTTLSVDEFMINKAWIKGGCIVAGGLTLLVARWGLLKWARSSRVPSIVEDQREYGDLVTGTVLFVLMVMLALSSQQIFSVAKTLSLLFGAVTTFIGMALVWSQFVESRNKKGD